MKYRDLFATPHARRTDPDTSHEAAASTKITKQALRVLNAYRGGMALTDHEAYQNSGFSLDIGHGQRCSDLRKSGLIERAGRGRSPAGKAAYVCVITQAGFRYLREHGL